MKKLICKKCEFLKKGHEVILNDKVTESLSDIEERQHYQCNVCGDWIKSIKVYKESYLKTLSDRTQKQIRQQQDKRLFGE
jgi:hypothetical protein